MKAKDDTPKQTPVTDYMSARVLNKALEYLEHESKRRGAAGENTVADALTAAHTYIARLLERTPLAQLDLVAMRATQTPDRRLADMQEAYDQIRSETGKAATQRAVTKRTGYGRETVRARWEKLIK